MKHALMNLRKLRHVITLASHGSYVAAARELNLSPSALSRSIQSVEGELNLVLFNRGKGGVFVTPAGVRVVNAAYNLIDNLTELQDSLPNLGNVELGEAAIGMAPMPSAVILPELLRRALEERKLRIQVHVEAGARLLELLNAGRIEFFIGTAGSMGRVPSLTVEPLVTVPVAARVRQGHPLADKPQVSREEFNSFPLVGGNFETNARLNIQPLRPYDPMITCDNYHILADAVRVSDAICSFPDLFETPGLINLHCSPDLYRDRIPLILCRLRSRRLSKASAAVLDRIQDVVFGLGLGGEAKSAGARGRSA